MSEEDNEDLEYLTQRLNAKTKAFDEKTDDENRRWYQQVIQGRCEVCGNDILGKVTSADGKM